MAVQNVSFLAVFSRHNVAARTELPSSCELTVTIAAHYWCLSAAVQPLGSDVLTSLLAYPIWMYPSLGTVYVGITLAVVMLVFVQSCHVMN
jgi:hypothetical protein